MPADVFQRTFYLKSSLAVTNSDYEFYRMVGSIKSLYSDEVKKKMNLI